MLDLIKWLIIFIQSYLCLQKQKAFRIKLMIKHEWWRDYCIGALFIYLFSLEINLTLDWVTLSVVFSASPAHWDPWAGPTPAEELLSPGSRDQQCPMGWWHLQCQHLLGKMRDPTNTLCSRDPKHHPCQRCASSSSSQLLRRSWNLPNEGGQPGTASGSSGMIQTDKWFQEDKPITFY